MKVIVKPFLAMLLLIAVFASVPVLANTSLSKVDGVLQAVSSKTHTLTLQVGSETKKFTYGQSTVFMNHNMRAHASALKAGEKLSIQADAKNFAHKVRILPASPAN